MGILYPYFPQQPGTPNQGFVDKFILSYVFYIHRVAAL